MGRTTSGEASEQVGVGNGEASDQLGAGSDAATGNVDTLSTVEAKRRKKKRLAGNVEASEQPGSDAIAGKAETPPIVEVQQRKKKRKQAPVDEDASAVAKTQSSPGAESSGVLASNDGEKVGANMPSGNQETTPKQSSGKKRKKVR